MKSVSCRGPHKGADAIVTLALRNTLRYALATVPLAALLTASAQFPRSITEPTAVERGAKIYAKDCAKCHGADARGTAAGPDMLRSTMVLHDRRENLRGKELAPYLKSTPPHHVSYNEKEAADLSQFLSSRVNSILRSGYDDKPKGLTNGDAKAGEAYFNGAGGCAKCHSISGDMAGIGKRYSPATLQQKIVFPMGGLGKKAPVHVAIRLPNGRTTEGDLVRMDDFTVTLKAKDGAIRSIVRTTGSKVTVTDPYEGHIALLDKITDADMHNLTTYLDTLQ